MGAHAHLNTYTHVTHTHSTHAFSSECSHAHVPAHGLQALHAFCCKSCWQADQPCQCRANAGRQTSCANAGRQTSRALLSTLIIPFDPCSPYAGPSAFAPAFHLLPTGPIQSMLTSAPACTQAVDIVLAGGQAAGQVRERTPEGDILSYTQVRDTQGRYTQVRDTQGRYAQVRDTQGRDTQGRDTQGRYA